MSIVNGCDLWMNSHSPAVRLVVGTVTRGLLLVHFAISEVDVWRYIRPGRLDVSQSCPKQSDTVCCAKGVWIEVVRKLGILSSNINVLVMVVS